MGISHSKTINHNEYDKNKFSDLYNACLENDIDLVQSLVATSSFEMINCHEINGSTALHIAIECGHTEIVRFLLHDYGVFRHLLDSQGRTAFELAQTDEIRQLFHRSRTDGNRFCNEMVLQFTVKESDEKKNVPCGRVEGHENYRSIANEKTHRLYRQPDSLFMRISDKIMPYKPVYYSLRFLHPRSFKGLCYRGLSMTMEELKDYQWATEKTSRYLVTNTFCSATRDINVAQNFANNCWTAIQLEKLSDQLPSISEIEDEREVLILSGSTFRVTKVESELPIAKIYLTFYPLDQELDDYSTVLAQIISEQ
ncbi:unnamed protein product [Didymodactylos carnosus]|uniref:NAD(P)(+)--arginine ADP-ribosyltransferase n=1 Tax=Didymodactylos carnosus TaxID=1234261 RepID=A0A8S2SN81_9BILA|nr:unnamed protein product [Didymodactylos carnosus]CAF4240508.1 unnamed protein product [Didymodactylos carnosus]